MRLGLAVLVATLAGIVPLASVDASPSPSFSNQRLTQMGHAVWRVQDGAFGNPNAIAQTTDGYVWLGTSTGLVRFDGVRFVGGESFVDESIGDWQVNSLFASRDGSLWIATKSNIVAQLQDGRLKKYAVAATVSNFAQDTSGTIWFALQRANGRIPPLCRIAADAVSCVEATDLPFKNASSLTADADGVLWIGGDQLCRKQPGRQSACFLTGMIGQLRDLLGIEAILLARDGTMWLGIERSGPGFGLGQVEGGQWKPVLIDGIRGDTLAVSSLLQDRTGAIWVGTIDHGIYRIRDQHVDHFDAADGLSSSSVVSHGLMEDREGSVWAVTSAGIDQFRSVAVSVFSTREGLPSDNVESLLPARDGSVWIGSYPMAHLVDDRVVPIPIARGLAGRATTSILEDRAGRLWVGLDDTLNVLGDGQVEQIHAPDGSTVGVVLQLFEDEANQVVAATTPGKLRAFRFVDPKHGSVLDVDPYVDLRSVAPDTQGGLWYGYTSGKLAHFRNGQWTVHPPDQYVNSAVRGIVAGPGDTVVAATHQGLLIQRGGARWMLDVAHGMPCGRLNGLLRDRSENIWISASCGLIAITDADLESWLASPRNRLRSRLFDAADGVQAGEASFMPSLKMAPDGRLWFATGQVAEVIDPGILAQGTPPPPVRLEAVMADGTVHRTAGPISLPATTRDLAIRYTALSFIAPQRIRFRYRLEGRDDAWLEVGSRREAFYTDLPPGAYRFVVQASNAEEQWGEESASVDFVIPPRFHQTRWFLAACLVALAALVHGLFRVRTAQFEIRVREQIAAKHAERERIARELHDTLLQSTEGLVLRFQAATSRIPAGDPMRLDLDRALARADAVIVEGRDRVQDLRTASAKSNGLPQAFASMGLTLTSGRAVRFNVSVEGTERKLDPLVEDEAQRIGQEALQNAFRHAGAQSIEVRLLFEARCFRLRIRDDGKGIDPHIIGGKANGRWGLKGMKERAQALGAHLEICSRPGAGTEIELRVPAAIAYTSKRRHWWRRLTRI